jgi:hypothetical protein
VPPQHPAEHHLIVVDDLLLDFEAQVGKCGPPRRDDVPHRRVAACLPDSEVGELVIDQILDTGQVTAVPDAFEQAADDRGVVLLGTHGLPLVLRGLGRTCL